MNNKKHSQPANATKSHTMVSYDGQNSNQDELDKSGEVKTELLLDQSTFNPFKSKGFKHGVMASRGAPEQVNYRSYSFPTLQFIQMRGLIHSKID